MYVNTQEEERSEGDGEKTKNKLSEVVPRGQNELKGEFKIVIGHLKTES